MSSAKQSASTGNNTAAAETKTEEKPTNQGFSLEEDDEFEDFPVEGEFSHAWGGRGGARQVFGSRIMDGSG